MRVSLKDNFKQSNYGGKLEKVLYIPEGSIRCIDHVTYVSRFENSDLFIKQWSMMGFHEHVRLRTKRFKATHIALVSGSNSEGTWMTMSGLSISEDPTSPINEFVKRYGEGIQHIAYNISPETDMDELYTKMKEIGWEFMTPVLTYRDSRGAQLRQLFTAPQKPYGVFTEFVQRKLGDNGNAFDSFDVENIDDLYENYAKYSQHIDKW